LWIDSLPIAQSEREFSGSTITGQTFVYLHADQLNTSRLATDSTGEVVWRWDSDAFGVGEADLDPDLDTEEVNVRLRFPGQYWDEETGLHYNYFRDYDPVTGRYIQSDPIGLGGGVNTYSYVDQNSLVNADATGLTRIRYYRDIGILVVLPEVAGRSSYSIGATTGVEGCQCDETAFDQGPIPDGDYFIRSAEINELTTWQTIKRNRPSFIGGGDWGSRNVRINPLPGTQTHARSGFYLHEGMFPGSAGCIDAGGGLFGNEQTRRLFEDIANDPDGIVPLTIK
jgi:RHS repeat-associated protein